jgi:rhodanese-related sulfurtransferase
MRRNTALLALVALCLTLTGAAAAFAEEKKVAGYGDISIKDLKAAIDAKNVTVIDVNGSDSYAEGHIPGAVDFEKVQSKLADVLPKDKNALVVAYCGGPQCGAYKAAAKAAVAMGYTNVKHLPDGISGWKKAGEKTEKAG